MIQQRHLVALGVSTLTFTLLLAGCSDTAEDDAATGGTAATTTGGAATGGAATGGAATGGAATGGAATGGAATGGTTGTGGGEASCEDVAACGGDVVGTWNVTSSCLAVTNEVNMMGFGLGCTAAPVSGTLQVTGSWTFNADGTFTDATTTSGTEELALPAACLNISGTVTQCDRLGGALGSLGYASVTCADAASGGCTCPATVQQTGGLGIASFTTPTSGTYTVEGNAITIRDNQYSYCIAGTTMTITPRSDTAVTGTVTGTVVFQKQ